MATQQSLKTLRLNNYKSVGHVTEQRNLSVTTKMGESHKTRPVIFYPKINGNNNLLQNKCILLKESSCDWKIFVVCLAALV